MNPRICIITDYRGGFWISLNPGKRLWSLDVAGIRQGLEALGAEVLVLTHEDAANWKGSFTETWVIYQCSSALGPEYRRFSENVLRYVELAGGRMVPGLDLLRAYDDKVFFEFLRRTRLADLCPQPAAALLYGVGRIGKNVQDRQVVVKSADGCQSRGVALARNRSELVRLGRLFRRRRLLWDRDWLFEKYRRLRHKDYPARELWERQLLVQEFVPGLENDYKVLVYGERLFVLERKNRKGDFRASGSGLFSWPANPPESVLTLAVEICERLDTPFGSFDIGERDGEAFLFEAQFVCFGPLTMEKSEFFYRRGKEGFERVEFRDSPEELFAETLWNHINRSDLG